MTSVHDVTRTGDYAPRDCQVSPQHCSIPNLWDRGACELAGGAWRTRFTREEGTPTEHCGYVNLACVDAPSITHKNAKQLRRTAPEGHGASAYVRGGRFASGDDVIQLDQCPPGLASGSAAAARCPGGVACARHADCGPRLLCPLPRWGLQKPTRRTQAFRFGRSRCD